MKIYRFVEQVLALALLCLCSCTFAFAQANTSGASVSAAAGNICSQRSVFSARKWGTRIYALRRIE
jgi:hypothetical protein